MSFPLLRFVCCTFLVSNVGWESVVAQTETQRQWLLDFARQQGQKARVERAFAESTAIANGWPIRAEDSTGRVIVLRKINKGKPVYFVSENLDAARTVSTDRTWPGGSGGFSLTGVGILLGIWDGGAVRTDHQEFGGRVTQVDFTSLHDDHSTHVAGTMIAGGVDPQAHGMAYQAFLDAYDNLFDFSEMAGAAAEGLTASNHSYAGTPAGWEDEVWGWTWWGDVSVSPSEDYIFGFYTERARDLDEIAANAPNYLVVNSGGNDRNDFFQGTHWHGLLPGFDDSHDPDGGIDGFDCVNGDFKAAKNILTVGAVYDIPDGYTDPSDVEVTEFSSWGPTDDGRIKPDIVANGYELYSSEDESNSDYGWKSGTSMAAPNVSGSLGLLLQHQQDLHGSVPLFSSTLKGLVIHAADEAGPMPEQPAPGPDYRYGWGLMNTMKAVQVMSANAMAGDDFNIRERTLYEGSDITFQYYSTGAEPLRATICWTDPPGNPPEPSLDPPDLMLVNDLDMRIYSPTGTTYYPYVLDPLYPSDPAYTGDNSKDNVEQIHIEQPDPGLYAVVITHKNTLTGGQQDLSLVITGVSSSIPGITITSPVGGEIWEVGGLQTVQWTSSDVDGNVNIKLSTDAGATYPIILVADTPNDGSESVLVPNTPSLACRIKVESVSNPSVFGSSPDDFSILPPPGGEQIIVAAEYFIDSDPGEGNGISIPIIPASEVSVTRQVSLPNLPVGDHGLYTRFFSSSGDWSVATGLGFRVEAQEETPSIVSGEYYFDVDPGIGSGVQVTLANPDTFVSITYPAGLPNLSTGEHALFLRWKSSSDEWSTTVGAGFDVTETSSPRVLTAAEFFLDALGPPGTGAFLSPLDGSYNSTYEVGVDTLEANPIPLGRHVIYARFQDSEGRWSAAIADTFHVQNHDPTITSIPDTLAFEDSLYTYQIVVFDIDPNALGKLRIRTKVIKPLETRHSKLSAKKVDQALMVAGSEKSSVRAKLSSLLQGDSLFYSFIVQPSWLNLSNTGLVSGTPTAYNVGDTVVGVRVQDTHGGQVEQGWDLQVVHVNQSPVLISPPDTLFAFRDSSFEYQINAFDPDSLFNDSLSYHLLVSPTWLVIDTSSGLISGTPLAMNLGDTVVAFYVEDRSGVQVADTSILQVQDVTGIAREDPIPKEFSLSQNYPNPFNPTTDIQIGLPLDSHLTIKIYNVLGEEVLTLIDGEYRVGYHRIRWQPTVASGVYFYRMTATNHQERLQFADIKKMILLR